MLYQGQQVNFSQTSMSDYNRDSINRIDTSLYTYPQQSNLSSAKSDTDIWNHLNQHVWGKSGAESSPKGNWSANPNAIVPNIEKNTNSIRALDSAVRDLIARGTSGGMTRQQVENIVKESDDRNLIHANLTSLGEAQKRAKTHRDNIESKSQGYKDEHSIFHTKLTSLGDSQTAAKNHRDSLEAKIQSHSHDNGGGGEDCGWFGEKCWFKNLLPTVPSTAILAAVGIGSYMLLKGKKLKL